MICIQMSYQKGGRIFFFFLRNSDLIIFHQIVCIYVNDYVYVAELLLNMAIFYMPQSKDLVR